MKQENLMEEADLSNYVKKGYLHEEFKMFYLSCEETKEFESHYHEFDKITIFLKGKVDYVIEGRNYRLEPYDIVLVGHHDIHRLSVQEGMPYERIVIYISQEFMKKYITDTYRLEECFLHAKKKHSYVLRLSKLGESKLYQVIREMRQILDKASMHEEYAAELYEKVLFMQFMVHLNRVSIGEKAAYLGTNNCNQKIVSIMDYINEHLEEELSIDGIAANFYMSKYHMMRLFKKETGYSIGNYVHNKRLLKAKECIRQGMPITEACYACGFQEYSSFSRAYKKLFGETPRDTKKF